MRVYRVGTVITFNWLIAVKKCMVYTQAFRATLAFIASFAIGVAVPGSADYANIFRYIVVHFFLASKDCV